LNPHGRYLILFAVTASLMLLVAAGIDWLVDPYALFGTPRVTGWNRYKPAAGRHARLAKPYMAARAEARTIIAGNSRPEMGLDPASRCWRERDRPVFDMALPGADLRMQARMLQHALGVKSLRGKRVYWGLDFSYFFVAPGEERGDRAPDYERRLRVKVDGQPNAAYWWARIEDYATTLFSLDTLVDSLATLMRQRDSAVSTRREDGFNPARDYVAKIAREGQAPLFAAKRRELRRRFAASDRRVFPRGREWSEKFAIVSRTLDYLRDRGVEVTLFINPYHIDYLTLVARSGRWKEFSAWKRALAHLARRKGIELWDFALLNQWVAERLPEPANRADRLTWFWEPSHYKAAYGERMLRQMLGRDCVAEEAFSPGVRLRGAAEVEALLRAQRDAISKNLEVGAHSP
jgi:hypothetical protein